MHNIEFLDTRLVQSELRRVLEHPLFARAKVLRDILAFLVDAALHNRKVDEAALAANVLAKEPDSFHPYKNANVRVQMRNLRLKLSAYYLAEPSARLKFRLVAYEVIIELHDECTAEARRSLNEARWLFESRFPVDLHHGIRLVEGILERHPRWVPAWVALNHLQISIATHGGGSPLPCLKRAEECADRGLEYDATYGPALGAKASIEAFLYWRWDAAQLLFERAIALKESVRHEHWYHAFLVATGCGARAAELIEECLCASEKPWPSFQSNLGVTLYVSRRVDAAELELVRANKLNPEDWSVLAWLAALYWGRGEYLKAAFTHARSMAAAKRSPPDRYFDMLNEGYLGSPAAPKLSKEHRGGVSEVGAMTTGAVLRNWNRSIDALERMYENRYPLVHFFPAIPLLDPIWDSPRFRAIYAQTGLALPPHVVTVAKSA